VDYVLGVDELVLDAHALFAVADGLCMDGFDFAL
jgi:hypothetical protein